MKRGGNTILELLEKTQVCEYEEIPSDAVVVCTRTTTPSEFDDNVLGVCSFCGEKVQYRPHVPERMATKMCMECFVERECKLS